MFNKVVVCCCCYLLFIFTDNIVTSIVKDIME